MFRALLARLLGDTRTSDVRGGDDTDGSDEADSGFVRSILDSSVLRGHGGGDHRAASELRTIQEEADRLESVERYRK